MIRLLILWPDEVICFCWEFSVVKVRGPLFASHVPLLNDLMDKRKADLSLPSFHAVRQAANNAIIFE
jgi:hypothetical protein